MFSIWTNLKFCHLKLISYCLSLSCTQLPGSCAKQHFGLYQIESICRQHIKFKAQMLISGFDRVKSIVGKGENVGY